MMIQWSYGQFPFLPFSGRNLLTTNCKISRRNCVRNTNQRGISPRYQLRGGAICLYNLVQNLMQILSRKKDKASHTF